MRYYSNKVEELGEKEWQKQKRKGQVQKKEREKKKPTHLLLFSNSASATCPGTV
jgi:hypothetical protein